MRPRIGMLGVGWIGRHRMQALHQAGAVEIAAIADTSTEMAAAAQALVPGAELVPDLEALLALDIDGVVIATPSALHASQATRALQLGVAVFCQKPLGRTEAEVQAVVEAARTADRLLAVDLSYRFTRGMAAIRRLVRSGGIGRVYAVDLVFHNAFGPDKPWFYDRARSGGGCAMDLGVHLIDLCLWVLDFPAVDGVSARLFSQGAPLVDGMEQVEDHAVASIDLAGRIAVRLACSWKLALGCDALISLTMHGTRGGASFRNINGSFYDFAAEHLTGTSSAVLVGPPDDWGGRGAVDWAERLATGERYDSANVQLVDVAAVLDRVYLGGGG